jgi:predicted alpha/beta-fold hydrolase
MNTLFSGKRRSSVDNSGGHAFPSGAQQTSSILDELIKNRSVSTTTDTANDDEDSRDEPVGTSAGEGTARHTNHVSILEKQPYGTITTSDGVELFYEHFGSATVANRNVSKPVVVLIHGWSGSRHYWDLNVRLIARHCKVVTFDLRHHGDSGKPNFGFHVARLASDLRDVLVSLELTQVTVVGASMGASIIWSYFELFGMDDGRIAQAVFVDQAPLQNIAVDWRGGSTGCYDVQSLTRLQCNVIEQFQAFARDNARFWVIGYRI